MPSLQEEERLLKPNTAKMAAFLVLKTAGIEGATPDEIQKLSTEKGIKTDWATSSIANLRTVGQTCKFVCPSYGHKSYCFWMQVLRSDIAFARISRDPKLKYALRALPGVVPLPDPVVRTGWGFM